jgi:hypothetical protein
MPVLPINRADRFVLGDRRSKARRSCHAGTRAPRRRSRPGRAAAGRAKCIMHLLCSPTVLGARSFEAGAVSRNARLRRRHRCEGYRRSRRRQTRNWQIPDVRIATDTVTRPQHCAYDSTNNCLESVVDRLGS